LFSQPKISLADLKTNILSGVTVALALVPEAIAFAFVAHVHPLIGLYAASIMCLLTSAFGGRPGMISGATGATAIVMVGLVVQHGVQYLFPAVILMGVWQIIFGAMRLGKFIRMVPHPVMLGFVNGLAVVIFLAQFGHLKVRDQSGTEHWSPAGQLGVLLSLVLLTMAVIYLLPKVSKAVPASLAAILTTTAVVIGFGIHTKTVGDLASVHGGFPLFRIPAVPLDWHTFLIILPYSVILAGVGLIETLLTLNLVDEITDTRGRPNRECLAQGVGNIVSGFFGAMGGCAMIGQTMINVNAGARRRIAGITAGLCLLSFILFASPLIERVPIAALVGVMFVVAEKTFEWRILGHLRKVPMHDLFIIAAVTLITIFTNLATAVLTGVVVAALVFAWQHAKEISVRTYLQNSSEEVDQTKVYELSGTIFFASISNFQNLFTPKDDPSNVVVEFQNARVMDHSALQAVESLASKYESLGKTLRFKHLSPDCYELLAKAKSLVDVNVFEDPRYRVADDRVS
jgi:sulfate permease, SulP family